MERKRGWTEEGGDVLVEWDGVGLVRCLGPEAVVEGVPVRPPHLLPRIQAALFLQQPSLTSH